MSTKTTFKRLALVTAVALGLGGLSAVSAQAVVGATATSISVGTVPAVVVGGTSYVPVKFYLSSTAQANDTMTVVVQGTSAPLQGGVANAASAFYPANNILNDGGQLLKLASDSAGSATTQTQVNGRTNAAGTLVAVNNSGGTYVGYAAAKEVSHVVTANDVALGYVTEYVGVTPDVAGTYGFMISTNATATGGYTAGDPTTNFTVTTGTAATSVQIASVAGAILAGQTGAGQIFKITLNNGASTLSGTDTLLLTTSGSGTISTSITNPSSFATTKTLTSANFTSGAAYVELADTGAAAETISLTVTGSGTLSASVAATTTVAVSAVAGSTAVVVPQAPSTTSLYTMNAATGTATAIAVTPTSTSQTLGMTFADYAGTYRGVLTVTDTNGIITGLTGAKYNLVYAVASGATGAAVTIPGNFNLAAAGTASYTVAYATASASTTVGTLGTAAGTTVTVTSAARTNAATFTVTPNSTFLAAPGAAIALTASLKDQFGSARSGQTVTITTSGRNNPTATTAVTDASGKVTFTTADASTSTTSLTDTVTFTSGSSTSSVTINYANTTVGTLTVTGGNTTASVANATPTINAISAGDGAEAGAQPITATVKDSLGNALAGVPVTFSVAGTGVAIPSNGLVKYTGSTGTASTSIYAWIAGTYTYTVTAGGKTTTGTITFADTTAASARTISVVAVGNVVTATVKDRFGNPVSASTVYIKTTGGANVGGAFQTSGTTLTDGTISWVVSGSGTATVYSNLNPSAVAGTNPSDQSCALAGNLTCASGATAAVAFTASTVGTTTTAETGVGASIAPAGNNSASVTVSGSDQAGIDAAQAAQDAANEATDAANAATDAANNAMDSADAAQQAAMDAGDKADAALAAVTDLATKVSEIATQISSLSAVVAKIAAAVAKISAKVKA